jgi:hypothetical protein
MNSDEPIDVTKLDNRKILHVIDNATGFCSICNKFERPELIKKNYVKCGEIKAKSRTIEDDYEQGNGYNPHNDTGNGKNKDRNNKDGNSGGNGMGDEDDGNNGNFSRSKNKPYDTISEHSVFEQSIFYQNKKNNRVLTNTLCDFYKGHFCCKCCAYCESLYYVPIWCLFLFIVFFLIFLAGMIVSAFFYYQVTRTDLKSYTGSCSKNTDCDTSKGLYCRKTNASSVEYCNCPALSLSDMCDCASSSNYWNGIKCANVHGYLEGPCSGNYSCTAGLICDRSTSKCICPPTTPLWNNLTKTCSYKYLGCFLSCINSTNGCDIDGSWYVLR